MWTQVLESGKVRYFERYTDATGKSRIASVTLPDARKSTEKVARIKLTEKIGKTPQSGAQRVTLTFGAMLTKYKAYLAREMKPQTALAADYQFRKIENTIGSDTMLTALSASYVRECLYADGSNSKYNERLKHFKAAMRWAYSEDLIENIDFLDKLVRKESKERKIALKDKYLEDDELAALLDGMKIEKWRLLTEFLVLSGLRIGEAMALTQKDVDLKEREIRINKTYSLVLNAVSDGAKTDSGERAVSIQDELLDCIHRINAIMPRRRKLFFDYDGYINYPVYCKYFRENTEKFVGRRLTPHALRHTHVALLAAAGISLDAISRRLGHADSEVTREIYMHVTKKLKEKDAVAIRAIKLLL